MKFIMTKNVEQYRVEQYRNGAVRVTAIQGMPTMSLVYGGIYPTIRRRSRSVQSAAGPENEAQAQIPEVRLRVESQEITARAGRRRGQWRYTQSVVSR